MRFKEFLTEKGGRGRRPKPKLARGNPNAPAYSQYAGARPANRLAGGAPTPRATAPTPTPAAGGTPAPGQPTPAPAAQPRQITPQQQAAGRQNTVTRSTEDILRLAQQAKQNGDTAGLQAIKKLVKDAYFAKSRGQGPQGTIHSRRSLPGKKKTLQSMSPQEIDKAAEKEARRRKKWADQIGGPGFEQKILQKQQQLALQGGRP